MYLPSCWPAERGPGSIPSPRNAPSPRFPSAAATGLSISCSATCINSGIYSTYVLIQFKSQSLLQHLREGWELGSLLQSHFIIPVPAQMRSPDENWYRGTADAIYQNINLIEQADPHVVVIFGADHIYRMNIREMIEFHEQKRAQVTIAAIPVRRRGARVRRDRGRARRLHHRLPREKRRTRRPCRATRAGLRLDGQLHLLHPTLLRELYADAKRADSSHDFGRDILPGLIGRSEMFAYDFQTNQHTRRSRRSGCLLARCRYHRRVL